ncbi:PQQ-binding-like beta-propeller repeat protein [Alicyclobacillus tolerans]|uniref:outer membrane protein assembly factor BamB family protein n=1 Tax=Alicyclobacillus tolerans TaxID=90970 RepID=UPI001F47C8EB|nr:PQQ-binding-like beta-propeller repeat protein [Alicyclobacillus tolerans]MCF8565403.1 PQQ-binding-like beta-propeller repeat protein [Alicyclobacillus tolerans]
MRVGLKLSSVLAVGLLLAGCGPMVQTSGASTQRPGSNNPAIAMAAQTAVRTFPSGSSAVVLCSGDPKQTADLAAGQALASYLMAPLLLTQNSNDLGKVTLQALSQMAVPNVNPGMDVQPFQPQAGKPVLYMVGNDAAFSPSLVRSLQAMGYQVKPVTGANEVGLLKKVTALVAPPLPSVQDVKGFPTSWNTYAGNPEHNPVYPAPQSAPNWEKQGVSWNFAEQAAVPFSQSFPDVNELGVRGAPVKMTQNLGNAVGVTAVNGIIYAESDDFHVYAVNAKTGQQLWQAGPTVNSLMGNPIVGNGLVYVTAGDTGFSFSQVLKFMLSQGKQQLTRGLMYSAIYAYDQNTGRLVWRQDFQGNAMPSPTLVGNTIYEATGDGHLYAFHAKTGKLSWSTDLGGFDSMSSANFWTDPKTGQTEILVGVSDANHVIAVDARTGKVLWKQPTSLNIFNTGMGDNTPAVDTAKNLVFQDSVVNFDQKTKTADLAVYAMDAQTGQVVWSTKLGRGSSPPAYKAGVVMVHNGVIYVGSPTTSSYYALNEQNGQILWTHPFSNAGPAGAGRGSAAYAYGVLWVAAGPTLYALNPADGKTLGSYNPGGRFGIVNPVIVGKTMYLDNSYDWVQAVPLSKIYPGLK